jgi:hypothetical protein
MDFFYGIVALLAFVVLILTALTAWMYVQQSRIMQAVSALTSAITSPPPTFFESAKEFPVEEEYIAAAEPEKEVDDRVSVHDEDDEGESEQSEEKHQEEQDDDLGGKTIAQLRDLLTGKGIPFNKSDKKPILLNLLKVAS